MLINLRLVALMDVLSCLGRLGNNRSQGQHVLVLTRAPPMASCPGVFRLREEGKEHEYILVLLSERMPWAFERRQHFLGIIY